MDTCRKPSAGVSGLHAIGKRTAGVEHVPLKMWKGQRGASQHSPDDCTEVRKSKSQVALNWLLQRDEHIIPIPGATSGRHAWENADTLTWELSEEEFRTIGQASSPARR